METSYYCRIDDINKLNYYHSDNVRWLEPVADYELIREYFSFFNVHNTTDTYFGICLEDMKDEWSDNEAGIGKLCAYIENDKILSFAGVEYDSEESWEIRAVSTRPDYLGKGYSKYVCSFIAKYILEQGKQAICETNIANYAMQSVTKKIGMVEYNP